MDLHKSPGFLVNKLANEMATELSRKFREFGVTTSQWAILALLWQQDGLTQTDIQHALGSEASTVTGIIQRMVRLDLIERKKDVHDKRIQLVYLTEKGKSLKDHLIKEAQSVNERALRGLTEDEQYLLIRLLTRALKNYETDH